LYVGGSGPGNYSKIQDAIDNASDGDTILVFSGTYYEAINISKQLFMRGIKLDGQDILLINGEGDHITVKINNDSCSFENFTIRNGDTGYTLKAISVLSDYNIIKNCTFYNSNCGICLSSSSGNLIRDNKFDDGGIHLVDSRGNLIKNNEIKNYGYVGILVDTSSWKNKIIDNVVINCRIGMMLKFNSSYNEIVRNNVTGSSWYGIWLYCSINNYVFNNMISDCSGLGIRIENTVGNSIDNNFISGCESGIGFVWTGSNNVTRNVISSNTIGISVSECSDIYIFNNHISDNLGVGIAVSYSDSIIIEKNNLVRNIPNALFTVRLLDLTTNKIKRNYWGVFSIILPKIIFVTLKISLLPAYLTMTLPWLYFDWRPALKPYDIGGLRVNEK
ncbi:MAG: right-handed parallel beta-helix repeat-containing protein, partial [Actinobacteria bacterium]|nr:right-handed parallel beta-helix repeat-containing protein [Actinomycetota bacterium]